MKLIELKLLLFFSIMEFVHYQVCCPLFPLFPRGDGYPKDYKLPPRMRPGDCLNLPKLTNILRESLLYESKRSEGDKSNICVVSVLSPYSFDTHVMIMDLNPHLYLPSPERIAIPIFNHMSKIVSNCIDIMREEKHKFICAAYNWSPFSYGPNEEKRGGQSITTKFHFAVWNWDTIQEIDKSNIYLTLDALRSLGDNEYGLPFSHLIYEKIQTIINECSLFDDKHIKHDKNCLFIPFKQDVTINDCLRGCDDGNIVQKIAKIIANCLNNITEILTDERIEDMYQILKNIENRLLTDDEIEKLRRNPHINPLDECLKKCENEWTQKIIQAIYQSAVDKENQIPNAVLLKKNFAYSLSLCESSLEHIKSGMRISFLPQCGQGGCIEPLGVLLTRPENALANESDLIKHNEQLCNLVDELSKRE